MPRYANITAGTVSVLEMVGPKKKKVYRLIARGEDFECSEEAARPCLDRGHIAPAPERAPFAPRM